MVDDEILALTYEEAPESLWKAVKQALSTGIGATLKEVEEEQRRATFTTDISWTSWGGKYGRHCGAGPTHWFTAEGNGTTSHVYTDHEMGRRSPPAPVHQNFSPSSRTGAH